MPKADTRSELSMTPPELWAPIMTNNNQQPTNNQPMQGHSQVLAQLRHSYGSDPHLAWMISSNGLNARSAILPIVLSPP